MPVDVNAAGIALSSILGHYRSRGIVPLDESINNYSHRESSNPAAGIRSLSRAVNFLSSAAVIARNLSEDIGIAEARTEISSRAGDGGRAGVYERRRIRNPRNTSRRKVAFSCKSFCRSAWLPSTAFYYACVPYWQ